MGFFSKKSTNAPVTTNVSTGFSELSDNATAIAGNNNTTTDHGAISGAFDFAGNVSEQNTGLAREVIQQGTGLARDLSYQSTSLAREVIGSTTAAAKQYGQQLESFASKAVADQGDQIAEVMKWAIGGAVLLAGFAFMRKGRA